MIINNIAIGYERKENVIVMKVIDLNNTKYKAHFVLNTMGDFELRASTFSEGKRKYEMLYYVEKNKQDLIEGYENA